MLPNRGKQVRKPTLTTTVICFLFCTMLTWPAVAWAQDPVVTETPDTAEESQVPEQVDVQPRAQDEEIAERLASILVATEWFIAPTVNVQDGVVFLDGRTYTEERREWAGNLARRTQDVVAVVNRIQVIPRSAWDFSPAWAEINSLWRNTIQAVPLTLFGIAVLVMAWWIAKFVVYVSRRLLRNRLGSPLLTTVASRTLAVPVFVLGLYLVLQVAGLTNLALTLLGGTGLAGIVLGFAFRDIAENFLASILLSIRQPFRNNDLIEVAGNTGIVQQMNTRSTVLMTLEGNYVQIPNSIMFKNTIINYTANPNTRSDYMVGIGYDDPIAQAQEIIAQVLHDHPAVLKVPESMVLVEELGPATVNLRVYFWFDASEYAPLKVKSSLVRLTKRALDDAAISMPDEAREVIFPKGVPLVQMGVAPKLEAEETLPKKVSPAKPSPAVVLAPEPVSTTAEGHLHSEDQEIQKQAQQSRSPEEGENLLEKK